MIMKVNGKCMIINTNLQNACIFASQKKQEIFRFHKKPRLFYENQYAKPGFFSFFICRNRFDFRLVFFHQALIQYSGNF